VGKNRIISLYRGEGLGSGGDFGSGVLIQEGKKTGKLPTLLVEKQKRSCPPEKI